MVNKQYSKSTTEKTVAIGNTLIILFSSVNFELTSKTSCRETVPLAGTLSRILYAAQDSE
jgi:hypothetical protein